MSLPRDSMQVLLLSNPSCSKCRALTSLLEEQGLAFEVRHYLDDPLDEAELIDLAQRLGLPPARWMRFGEPAFLKTGLSPESPDEELFRALSDHPILMERPILVRGPKAIVGRPPELALGLLD